MMPAWDRANERNELWSGSFIDQRPCKSLPPTLHHLSQASLDRPWQPCTLAAWHKVQTHVLTYWHASYKRADTLGDNHGQIQSGLMHHA